MFKKPYHRKFYRKKYNNKRSATVGLVKKVVSTTLKRHSELKCSDITIGHSMDTTGYVYCLNGLILGTTNSTRVGQRTIVKSIVLSLDAKVQSLGVDQNCRICIIQRKQANGASQNFASLYPSCFNSSTPLAIRNINNVAEYKVLWDYKFDLGSASKDSAQKVIKKYIRCYIPVYYNAGNSGEGADIDRNAIYLCMVSDEAGTAASTVVGYARVRYTD